MRMLRPLFLLTAIISVFLSSGCGHFGKERESIIVQGEVNRPGVYYIEKKLAFIVVVLGARGYTSQADPTKVIIERDSKSFVLDMSTPKDKPGPFLAVQFKIQDGDVITVPKKSE